MRKSKYCLSLLLGIAIQAAAYAQPMPVQSIHKESDGVTVQLKPGQLRLQVCTDRIIHVTYSPTDTIPARQEFVVTQRWSPVPYQWREEAANIQLSTGKMSVQVSRSTGALTFTDASGKILLQESPDGGKRMTPATVNKEATYTTQQTFLSPPDEYLYGMAEAQGGHWNWRGLPIELRQLNTQAALPMLVSTKGYGLLWDNASLTDFNPVDGEVPLTASTATATTGPTATEQLQNAPKPKTPLKAETRLGRFTTGEAGEYVFFIKDGDRRNDIGVEVNGQTLGAIHNMWVPYTLAAKTTLPANTACEVKILGGGKNAKVFARPLGNTTTFRSQVGDTIDYYFFYGPELDDVIAGYRTATGAAPLWPQWAYGFWQCRERYSSQKQILETVAEFRKRQIPVDLLVQDWQYWGPHGWGAYEWDQAKYPDPAAMLQDMHQQHVKFMISVWSNPHGRVGQELKRINGFIGTEWMDVFNPEVRALRWRALNEAFFHPGTDAWWQDATEPGDDGNALDNRQTFAGSGNRYRNLYPMLAQQAIYDGQRATDPEKRVCILTRSAFPGQQRYASGLWSGDINGDWITFRRQIPAGLNVCLTGLPYWTTDCGGFFRPGNQMKSADYNDLLVRWFQFSTFCPILRIHGYQTETEMWKWPLAQDVLLKYDQLRYRMLPYNYSGAWQVTHAGSTLMRALPMDFRSDPKVNPIGDEYMFGPAFLVSPVTEPGATSRKVYLPAGTTWTNFWTGERHAGGQSVEAAAPREILPLFVRAGSIVPLGPVQQYAGEKPADPLELRVYPGANGSFTLYEDEGDSYRYEKGAYAEIPMQWDEAKQTLTLGPRRGEFPGMLKSRTFHVTFVRPGKGLGDAVTETCDAVCTYQGSATTIPFTPK